jgi:RND family efflux transporter MFP subunit
LRQLEHSETLDHSETRHRVEGSNPGPTSFAPATGRRLQIFAGAIALALLIGFLVVRHANLADERALERAATARATAAPEVVVATARQPPGFEALALPGETRAWFESTIYARVNGYVDKWFVDIGDHVRKGQVLVTIDTPDLDAELAATQAKLQAAEADVKVREAEAAFAKTTYERWRDSPKGVVSEQEREAKKADYESTIARLKAATAQVELNQAEVDRLTALTQFKQVTAPYDGVIIERRIDIGNLVTAGSTSATTPLYRMSQDDPMRVFVDVPQAAGADMAVGLHAVVTANDLPGQSFDGTIARTSHAIDPNARTLRVEVDIPNPEEKLVPGMYVEVTFDLKAKGLAEVPPAALVFRARGPQIAVVNDAGIITFRDVTIARDDGNVVKIASGVSPGDKVVLNISSDIANGDKVTVAKSDEEFANARRRGAVNRE